MVGIKWCILTFMIVKCTHVDRALVETHVPTCVVALLQVTFVPKMP